jgi:serine/threonine protein phosphatase 1
MSKAVYAIGDIHGFGFLLKRLQDAIVEDANEHWYDDCTVVYVGDYIDRGLQSRQVIQHLIDAPLEGFKSVFLMGNHEELFMDFMETLPDYLTWVVHGGIQTAASYGVPFERKNSYSAEEIHQFSEALVVAVPEEHKTWMKNLPVYHIETIGDVKYLFVHAGIRPGVPLKEQVPSEMIWIRDLFLKSTLDHGYRVIHGHSPKEEPEVLPNRINVDTGVFFTGKLTAVVLDESNSPRFIQVE